MSHTAFELVSLPNCRLSSQSVDASGTLSVEVIGTSQSDDTFLVLRCGDTEIPIEPSRICTITGSRFTFEPSDFDSLRLELTANGGQGEDELLENIFAEYCDLRSSIHNASAASEKRALSEYSDDTDATESIAIMDARSVPLGNVNQPRPDLAGQLVMVNEESGEVVGQVSEAPNQNLHEEDLSTVPHNDPVVVEVDEDDDGRALEVYVKTIPPQERDWISHGAIAASKIITGGTTLLLSGFAAATDYYVKSSKPSPHASTSNVSSVSEKDGQKSPSGDQPPPVPPRLIKMLNSPRTKQNLQTASKYSGKAVQVSGKTVRIVDDMIRKAVGRKAVSGPSSSRAQEYAPTGSTMPDSYASAHGPPPGDGKRSYGQPHDDKSAGHNPRPDLTDGYSWTGRSSPYPASEPPSYASSTSEKPPLPPRTGLEKPPLPPRGPSPTPLSSYSQTPTETGTSALQKSTTGKGRLLLSLSLILDTLDHNTKRVLNAGTEGVGRVMNHKYGKDAAENSMLAAGTARDAVLVYVDVRGFTHRALLKRAGKHYMKGKLEQNKAKQAKNASTPGTPV